MGIAFSERRSQPPKRNPHSEWLYRRCCQKECGVRKLAEAKQQALVVPQALLALVSRA